MTQMNKATIYFNENASLEEFTQALTNKFNLQIDDSVNPPIIFVNKTFLGEFPQKQSQLKPKELQVLEYLKNGLTYSEIATIAPFSINGVRYYVKKIYKKLGVNNARNAVNKYFG